MGSMTEDIVLEQITYAVRRSIDRKMVEDTDLDIPSYHLHRWVELASERYVLEMRMILLGKTNQEARVKYPADWKQAIKERFAPAWALNRWPVKYTEVVITAKELYPSIPVDLHRSVFQVTKRVTS